MRWRSRILILIAGTFAALAVIAVAATNRACRVTASIVNAAEANGRRQVTVEFLRHTTASCFVEKSQVQVRAAGQWLAPTTNPEFDDAYLLTRTNRQQFVFDVPHEAEALKISLDYRTGSSPYCQAYGFFLKHGISQKFPTLSTTLLNCVPKKRKLRHVEWEFAIPATTPAATLSLTKTD